MFRKPEPKPEALTTVDVEIAVLKSRLDALAASSEKSGARRVVLTDAQRADLEGRLSAAQADVAKRLKAVEVLHARAEKARHDGQVEHDRLCGEANMLTPDEHDPTIKLIAEIRSELTEGRPALADELVARAHGEGHALVADVWEVPAQLERPDAGPLLITTRPSVVRRSEALHALAEAIPGWIRTGCTEQELQARFDAGYAALPRAETLREVAKRHAVASRFLDRLPGRSPEIPTWGQNGIGPTAA